VKGVHIERDPVCAIASGMRRLAGDPAYAEAPGAERLTAAAWRWAALTAHGRLAEEEGGAIVVRYEDLAREPDAVLETVLEHLGFAKARKLEDGPAFPGLGDDSPLWRDWTAGLAPAAEDGADGLSEEEREMLGSMVFEFPAIGQRVDFAEEIERAAALA